MNYSELIRVLSDVAEDFATTLGVDPTPFAARAANDVPADYHGDVVKEFRRACETTARKIDNGGRLEKPGLYALRVFSQNLQGSGGRPKAASPATVDPFVAETIREIEEADAEIRRMPQSRHDRVRAIEQWRNGRFTSRETPTPLWALYGFDSSESYEESARRLKERRRAEQGLATPQPKGVQSMATVIKHSQTLRTLDEALNEDDL